MLSPNTNFDLLGGLSGAPFGTPHFAAPSTEQFAGSRCIHQGFGGVESFQPANRGFLVSDD
jgi:hypothetical protein